MKLLVFTFLLSFSLVFAGNGPENSCFNGTSTNGEGEENIIACNFPFDSCITKIESQAGVYRVDRGCLQTQACENQMRNNPGKCYPGENGVRLCWFCCQGRECNRFPTMIPEEGAQSGDGETGAP